MLFQLDAPDYSPPILRPPCPCVVIFYINSRSWKSVSFFKTALMNFPKLLIFFSLAFFSKCFRKSLLKSILNFMA